MYVAMFTSVRVSTSVLLRGVNDWPAPPPISIDLNYSEELWEWGRWQRSLSRTLEGSHFPLIPLCVLGMDTISRVKFQRVEISKL